MVREDNERKDLLFAGTELGLYISWDGGEQWQPFQSNLPVTPITDLKVHQGDLIAATAGRSFCILDDLGMVRQWNRQQPGKSLVIYKPEPGYRVSGASMLDRIEPMLDDSAIVVPNSVAGTNPTTGVAIYYHLPAGIVKDSTITLEIRDQQGNLVRTFSNQADKKFQTYPGGPAAEPVLTAAPGLNRFVWNLRHATLPGVPTVFIEGNYAGRRAIPGDYTVRVKAIGQEQTVPLTILPDPRVNVAATAYAQQDKLVAAIDAGVKEIHTSVLRLRSIKKQVGDLIPLIESRSEAKPVVEKGKELVKKLDAWEAALVQNKAQANDDVINFENKLSADYLFLKGELDTNVPHVRQAQQERLQELDAAWQTHKTAMNTILKDVENFNLLCQQAKVTNIIVPVNP